MYIIGGDGKEYGPVAPETIRQWLAEGRVDYRTRVRGDAETEWRTLGDFPELTGQTPAAPPRAGTVPPPAPQFAAAPDAAARVNGPAIGLIVSAILGALAQVTFTVIRLAGVSFANTYDQTNPAFQLLAGGLSVVGFIVGIAVAGLVLFGALKMKKLESHNWAMAASILAMIPCISPCCVVGLPVGIWSLVVLSKPEVKAAFQH